MNRLLLNQIFSKIGIGSSAFFLFLFFHPIPADAHRVNVFAWVEGDTVHVEGKFAGGGKIKGGQVVVFDAKGNELLTGKTDDEGSFTFKAQRQTDLKIVIDAGMGHRNEWIVPLSEIEKQEITKINTAKVDIKKDVSPGSQNQIEAIPSQAAAPSSIRLSEIEQIMGKVLDEKLKPVMAILVESQQKGPELRDIIAGIGYIAGLAGIAAYFFSRKKK